MKKWLKLWIVALSLIAMATTIYTANVKADDVDQTVSVSLREWTNECTLDDYAYWTVDASVSDVTLTWITHTLSCTLLRDGSGTITLQLFDLSWANQTQVIPSWNFNAVLSGTVTVWSLDDEAATSSLNLGTIHDAYAKGEHKVWTMDRDVTISWKIDAWQPVDTYQGILRVFVPNSATTTP